jgi:hypothetical protein
MPDFGRVHLTVAGGFALGIAVFLPAMVAWAAGVRPTGLVALVVASFAAVVWAQLAGPAWARWLNVVVIILLVSPAREVAQQLFAGQHELQAWGLLLPGLAGLLLGGIRLLRLTEDMPNYTRLARGELAEWGEEKTTKKPGSRRAVPWPWEAEQQAAHAIRHARRAAVSRWSRICRWQAGVVTLRQVLPVIVVGTFLSFGWARNIDRPEAQRLLIFFPGLLAIGVACHRPFSMATQLCLPVARREYLKQLGAVKALSCLEMWFAFVSPFLVWCTFARPRPDLAEVGRLLTVSLLILVWCFGVGVWFARFRSPSSSIPLGAMGLALLLALLAFLYFRQMMQSPSFQMSGAVAAAIIGVLLAGDAYRRWLVTDLE